MAHDEDGDHSCAGIYTVAGNDTRARAHTHTHTHTWRLGIYTIAGNESKEFPKDIFRLSNIRVVTLEKCQLEQVACARVCACVRVCTCLRFGFGLRLLKVTRDAEVFRV